MGALAEIALILLLVSSPALATRVEFVGTVDGRRVEGCEICFRVGRAQGNPFEIFAASDDRRCASADKVIQMPQGVWIADMHHPEGYVSSHPLIFIQEGDDVTRFRTVEVTLRKAAVLDFSDLIADLKPGQFPAVYISNSNSPGSPGIIRPLSREDTLLAVPADDLVVPMIVGNGQPDWVGPIYTLAAGERRSVRAISPARDGEMVVVGWIKVDWGAFDEVKTQSALSPLRAAMVVGAQQFEPLIRLRDQEDVELQLVFFKAAAGGPFTVTISGSTWEESEVVGVPSPGRSITFIDEPLRAAPASRIVVSWSDSSIGDLLPRSCDEGEADRASGDPHDETLSIRLLRCPGLEPASPPHGTALDRCLPVMKVERPLTAEARRAEFNGVTAGSYLIEMKHPRLPPYVRSVFAEPGSTITVEVSDQYGSIFGKVSKGTRPLRAEIRFWSGTAYSDPFSGDYHAVLAEAPAGEAIFVRPCGGDESYFVLPDEPLALNQRYDIVLADNEVTVEAVDSETGEPLHGARVDVVVHREKGPGAFSAPSRMTAADGTTSYRAMPSGRTLSLCAEKEGYERKCDGPIAVPEGAKRVQVRLRPEGVREGRLLSGRPALNGALTWFRRDGVVTETAAIDIDGRFTYKKDHGEDEHCVFVAANLPMVVFRSLPTGEPMLEVDVRAMRSHSFTVRSRAGTAAYLGLAVGGVAVPSHLFVQHQSFRGAATMLLDGRPMVITDIGANEPVEVVLGPHPSQMAALPDGVDWIFTPSYNAYPTIVVPASGSEIQF